MVTIEDLPQKSISEMTIDEGIELLRQIRLSRRTPSKSSKAKKQSAKKKKAEPKLTSAQAKKLREMIEREEL